MKQLLTHARNLRLTKSGFTFIELVAAVGIIAVVITFATAIFRVSIDSYRMSLANAEVMRKLRAITGQLDADFGSVVKDAPLFARFALMPDPNGRQRRYDQVMLFAVGDFQSTRLYASGVPDDDTGQPIHGNIARVYWGQAQAAGGIPASILARRLHILSADTDLAGRGWPADGNDISASFIQEYDPFLNPNDPNERKYHPNESYEYDYTSLAHWKNVPADEYFGNQSILETCFGSAGRPIVGLGNEAILYETMHKLLCEGVSDFSMQWAYWDRTDKQVRWYPSVDPDRDGDENDSHFDDIGDYFGVYFNVSSPPVTPFEAWYEIGNDTVKYDDIGTPNYFEGGFYPAAFKFTFTLHDSKGILKNGRHFTHIVYVE